MTSMASSSPLSRATEPMSDDNPRPHKRQRTQSSGELATPESLRPLPPAVLLVSLPALLVHPPNHRLYPHSLFLSLASLRKCLALPALSPEIECRAWTGLAEIGMKVIGGGLSQSEEHPWAKDIETEVGKAISKGSIIAQKHPSLRAYRHHLVLLQAQLSHWQHKTKFARTQMRNLIASFWPTDPPHIVYSAHLAAISLLTTPNSPPTSSLSQPTHVSLSPPHSRQDIHAALAAIQELERLSITNGHTRVTLFIHVLRLRILVAANMWADVPDALQRSETSLGLSYTPASTPKPRKDPRTDVSTPPEATFVAFEDPLEAAMVVHLLIMAVVFYTHVGSAVDVSPRLSHLHALLDSDVLEKFPYGCIDIALPTGPPLMVQVTHPRVLYLLTFLISSTAKRDAVGRKPKRKLFAAEGLVAWDNDISREILFSTWSGQGDVYEVEQRLARIKADLLCELAAVSIMRSEFDAAEENLNLLIAHTRTYDIFPLFSARIALHHAHLAHATGQTSRALQCYRTAAHLAEHGSFVEVAARAGDVTLRIGLAQKNAIAEGTTTPETVDDNESVESVDFERDMQVVEACRGMGGTLEAVGQVIEACMMPEILKAKQHLKFALELATKAQDNHLRALILALIASHYLHTAGDHARTMLQTCEQLAAGLGAPSTKSTVEQSKMPVVVGNVPLGLWVGERFLELFNRAGKEARAQKQAAANAQFAKAVEDLARRGMTGA